MAFESTAWFAVDSVRVLERWYTMEPTRWSVRRFPGMEQGSRNKVDLHALVRCGRSETSCTTEEIRVLALALEQRQMDSTAFLELVNRSGSPSRVMKAAVTLLCLEGDGEPRCLTPGRSYVLVVSGRGTNDEPSEFPFEVSRQNAWLSFVTGLSALAAFLWYDLSG